MHFHSYFFSHLGMRGDVFTPVDSRGISFSQVTPRPPGGAPQPPLSWRDNFDAERHRATGGGAPGGAGLGGTENPRNLLENSQEKWEVYSIV